MRSFLIAFTCWATISSHATPDSTYEFHGAKMTLRGESMLTVGYVFKVYDARLLVGEPYATADVLSDVPKRLEIKYLRSIEAADIVGIGDETIKRQVPAAELASLQARIETINRWYTDVRAGDTYTLTYVPGKGSELALNGKALGVIEGADFAQAYFGIWLDPRTKYKDFRRKLLSEGQSVN
jgi:hypothetical protein